MKLDSRKGEISVWLILSLLLILVVVELGLGSFFYFNKKNQQAEQTLNYFDNTNTEQSLGGAGKQLPINIIYPNGGEVLEIGKTYEVRWSGGSNVDNKPSIGFGLVSETGVTDTLIGNFPQATVNDGSEDWTVGSVNPGKYRFRVLCLGQADTNKDCDFTSNNFFDVGDDWFTIISSKDNVVASVASVAPIAQNSITSFVASAFIAGDINHSTNISWLSSNSAPSATIIATCPSDTGMKFGVSVGDGLKECSRGESVNLYYSTNQYGGNILVVPSGNMATAAVTFTLYLYDSAGSETAEKSITVNFPKSLPTPIINCAEMRSAPGLVDYFETCKKQGFSYVVFNDKKINVGCSKVNGGCDNTSGIGSACFPSNVAFCGVDK